MSRGIYLFKVRTYECGPDGYATLATICNYLQEAASMNAGELGFSKADFDSAGENISWVLTRLSVRMKSYPRWEDSVTVETFPRGGRKIVAWRDFEIKNAAGETLGAASSEWMLIDLKTRKIRPVPQAVLSCADPANAPVLGEDPFEKIRYPSHDTGADASFTARKFHIDLNGHVNNVHYIEWMLEPCASQRPRQTDIIFKGETLVGDEVRVSVSADDAQTYHRVFSPDGKDHVIARTSAEPALNEISRVQ